MRPRPLFACIVALVTTCLACAGKSASSGHTESDARFSAETRERCDVRGAAVSAEIESLGDTHPWAGTYKSELVYLVLAPQNGFVYWETTPCLLSDLNLGSIREAQGVLHLAFEMPPRSEVGSDLATLVLVPWGERHYLVPPSGMKGFVNDVNSGDEPRDERIGSSLLRWGEHELPVHGAPSLPAEFAALLLDAPIEGRITRVDVREERKHDIDFSVARITIALGSKDGVFEGMELGVVESPFLRGIVDRVGEHECEIELVWTADLPFPAPQVGWRCSSRR